MSQKYSLPSLPAFQGDAGFFLYRGYHCEELELRGAQALCCQKYHISVQLTLLKLVIQSPTFDL